MVNGEGQIVPPYDSKVMDLANGLTSMTFGPIRPHTTRTEAPRCVDCHLDPKALGLGEGRMAPATGKGRLEAQGAYDSRASGLQIPYPLDAIVDRNGKTLQGTSHTLSRPFNREEIGRILGIGPCLPCHDRYDDPVWQKPGPYKLMPPCVKRLEQAR
ncbi:MAG: hypothetical protein AB1646_21630 [Thermodesulfobacteriota bacterium]